jgi:hypothetical protein
VSPDPRDTAVNTAFALYAIDKAAPAHGPNKLQAALFLLELSLKEKGMYGPRFTFVQSSRGPFSKELCDTLDELQRRGFVDGKDFNLTERGKLLRDLILPELRAIPENEKVFAVADSILTQCQPETGDSLLRKVCDLVSRPQGESETVKAKDLPRDKVLIAPVARWLKVPEQLMILFVQEFELTQEQIIKADKDWPEIESRALDRLRRGMNGGQPV